LQSIDSVLFPTLKHLHFLFENRSAGAIFLGVVASFLFAAPVPLIPFLAFLPLLLSLWLWGEEGLFISSAAALVLVMLFTFYLPVITFVVIYVFPLLCLGRILPKTRTLSKAAQSRVPLSKSSGGGYFEAKLVGLYVLIAAIVALATLWLLSQFVDLDARGAFFEQLLSQTGKSQDDPLRDGLLITYSPALMGILWAGVFALNISLSLMIARRIGVEVPFSWDGSRWALGTWPYGIFAVVLMGAVLGPNPGFVLFARNLLPALTIPFWVEGALVTNSLIKRLSQNCWIQRFLWAGLALLGWPLLMVLFLGFIEPWSQLRLQSRKRL
jgi:hypothetical protein